MPNLIDAIPDLKSFIELKTKYDKRAQELVEHFGDSRGELVGWEINDDGRIIINYSYYCCGEYDREWFSVIPEYMDLNFDWATKAAELKQLEQKAAAEREAARLAEERRLAKLKAEKEERDERQHLDGLLKKYGIPDWIKKNGK